MADNVMANPDLAYDATTVPKAVIEPEHKHHVPLKTGDKEWDSVKHAKRPNHERHTGVRARGMRHAPEPEKKHGAAENSAGKGNWGNERDGEEVLEEESADQLELAEHILAEEDDAEAQRAQREAIEPTAEEAKLKTLEEYENGT